MQKKKSTKTSFIYMSHCSTQVSQSSYMSPQTEELTFIVSWPTGHLFDDKHFTRFLSFAEEMADHVPSVAMEAVLKPSCDLPEDLPKIRGYDFNQGVDLQAVLKSYLTTGFQASSLSLAIQEINHMVRSGEQDFVGVDHSSKVKTTKKKKMQRQVVIPETMSL